MELGVNVPWSRDNLAEMDKGWIMKEETIEELAKSIGDYMNPSILKQTIETWNADCRNGVDTEFERSSKTLSPLKTPPYYAVTIKAGSITLRRT